MRQPIQRPGIYEHYWTFAAKRHEIFTARAHGLTNSVVDDPVLAAFKFCNAYRAADRVSQYLIRQISYAEELLEPADVIFQTVFFRTFSRIATWEHLIEVLGEAPRIVHLRDGRLEAALTGLRSHGEKIYTGAFILCATDAYGRGLKHLNHIELFKHMFLGEDLAGDLLDAHSLESMYHILHAYPLMGDFMSYQIAIDLNYSALFNFSEDEFTQPGPGALRGIKKVFLDTNGLRPSEVVMWMVQHQAEAFASLGIDFPGLWGRPLSAIDCQNLFCETDKYLRAVAPELASARTRIKARFTPSPAPLPLFFPPKWGINAHLPVNGTKAPSSAPRSHEREQLVLL